HPDHLPARVHQRRVVPRCPHQFPILSDVRVDPAEATPVGQQVAPHHLHAAALTLRHDEHRVLPARLRLGVPEQLLPPVVPPRTRSPRSVADTRTHTPATPPCGPAPPAPSRTAPPDPPRAPLVRFSP